MNTALDTGQPRTQVTMGFGIHAEGLLRKTLENDPDMLNSRWWNPGERRGR